MAVLRVSIISAIGCFVLVINAALSFLPFIGLQSAIPKRIIYVEGVLSVISCALFLTGSIIAFWESWKASAGQGGYFGWELEDYSPIETKKLWEGKGEFDKKAEEAPELPLAHYLHQNSSHAKLFDHRTYFGLEEGNIALPQTPPPPYLEEPSWRHVTAAHGFHEIYCNLGLIASAIFLVSSLIYCATALASLVTIFTVGEVFRPIRYPQLVGGAGFTIGSLLLLIKTQKDTTGHWWKPALRRLAWHVNLWNLVGSAGFVFCACFGLLAPVHWTDFQFNCTYLWGSWAFLLGSMIQWYKARHKMKFHHRFVERLEIEKHRLHLHGQFQHKP